MTVKLATVHESRVVELGRDGAGCITGVRLTTAQPGFFQQSNAEHNNGHSHSDLATSEKVGISDLFPLL